MITYQYLDYPTFQPLASPDHGSPGSDKGPRADPDPGANSLVLPYVLISCGSQTQEPEGEEQAASAALSVSRGGTAPCTRRARPAQLSQVQSKERPGGALSGVGRGHLLSAARASHPPRLDGPEAGKERSAARSASNAGGRETRQSGPRRCRSARPPAPPSACRGAAPPPRAGAPWSGRHRPRLQTRGRQVALPACEPRADTALRASSPA